MHGAVINMATGATEHWLAFGSAARELYDIASVPGMRTPMTDQRFQARVRVPAIRSLSSPN